jgi:serine/threonine-protein kinase
MAKLSPYMTGADGLRMLGDIYYAQANAYFEMEDYPNSLASYAAAADGAPDNPELYRDWAISLARCGYVERAEDMLRDVEDMDIGADSIDLLRGEISYAKGEDQAAIDLLEGVIRLTDSDYIKNRAYIICDKAYRRVPALTRANIALLRAALDDLPAVYAPIIKERLADALSRAGEYTEAAALFEELLQGGNLSYQTRQNIGVLYQQLGDYVRAKTVYEELASDYPDDYRPYMRLGYLALEEQAALPNELREYRGASEYYSAANARYGARGPGAGDDLEMQKLEGLIAELRQNGWIN